MLFEDFVVFSELRVRLLQVLQLLLKGAFVQPPRFLFAGLVSEALALLFFLRFELVDGRLELLDGLGCAEQVFVQRMELGLVVGVLLIRSGLEVLELAGVAFFLLREEGVAFVYLGFELS